MQNSRIFPLQEEVRRTAPRQSVLLSATLHPPEGAPVKCIVRNRSDDGVQLVVSKPGEVPDAFVLRIGKEAPRHCQVAWRAHGLVGIVYVEAARPDSAAGGDRRRAARKATLKGGTIVFNGGHSTVPCRIVDMSETGARLRPLSPGACPSEFDLIVGNRHRYQCLVARRIGDDLGVEFLGSHATDR